MSDAALKPQESRPDWAAGLDAALADLDRGKHDWARTTNAERIAILADVKERVMEVAEAWAKTAARKKGMPAGSPREGEEWLSGPYCVMAACDRLIKTLSEMPGKQFLNSVLLRELPNGQLAALVAPSSIWERLLFTGVKAEVWMQPGVTRDNLAEYTASGYDDASAPGRIGKVALVLGAGNVASIAPLDCFQKLFVEHQVVILKMNPVNDYLIDFLKPALRSLIEFGALRIVSGGTDVGAYLCNHELVEEIHITGAAASHDAIVWGPGEEGKSNKASGTPRNHRRVTSELGGVSPTIIVPGPWKPADIAYHAELIATQKLNNSGFNCVACQMLILPEDWDRADQLVAAVGAAMKAAPPIALYYPGAGGRIADFEGHGEGVQRAAAAVIVSATAGGDDYFERTEVFAPALSVIRLDAPDAAQYLRAAIRYANDRLAGTLGANIIIHPSTIREIGRATFETIVADLRYGIIAINSWSGFSFSLFQAPWGAFPGHTPQDVGSGIGVVHNGLMFEKPERTVVEAPFRVFPKPAWFVSHRKAGIIGRLLTAFEYRPSFAKLPRILWNALSG